MISNSQFIELLEKFIAGNISPEEHDLLFKASTTGSFDEEISAHIESNLKNKTLPGELLPAHRANEIIHKILQAEKQTAVMIPKHRPASVKILYKFFAAASLAGLLFFTSVKMFKKHPETQLQSKSSVPFFLNKTTQSLLTKNTNHTKYPVTYELEDGSVIVLKPGSSIEFPKHFPSSNREVYLEGEAFFQVAKNPLKPFYVHTKNIETRVLGTSFNVKENPLQTQCEVAVRSGKVEVYETLAGNRNTKIAGVILLPNQKAIYEGIDHHFISTLVDMPLPVIEDTTNSDMANSYNETPLINVFPSLEKTYGIQLIVENENIYKCHFTGDLDAEDLYTNLNIICKVLNTTYDISGTNIIIRGKGCDQ